MPGTADTRAIDEAFGERAVIMAAMGVDGENLRARTHQQHFFVADMAEQCRAGNSDSAMPCDRSGPAGTAC